MFVLLIAMSMIMLLVGLMKILNTKSLIIGLISYQLMINTICFLIELIARIDKNMNGWIIHLFVIHFTIIQIILMVCMTVIYKWKEIKANKLTIGTEERGEMFLKEKIHERQI